MASLSTVVTATPSPQLQDTAAASNMASNSSGSTGSSSTDANGSGSNFRDVLNQQAQATNASRSSNTANQSGPSATADSGAKTDTGNKTDAGKSTSKKDNATPAKSTSADAQHGSTTTAIPTANPATVNPAPPVVDTTAAQAVMASVAAGQLATQGSTSTAASLGEAGSSSGGRTLTGSARAGAGSVSPSDGSSLTGPALATGPAGLAADAMAASSDPGAAQDSTGGRLAHGMTANGDTPNQTFVSAFQGAFQALQKGDGANAATAPGAMDAPGSGPAKNGSVTGQVDAASMAGLSLAPAAPLATPDTHAPPTNPSTPIQDPVGSQAWAGAVGNRVVYMVQQNLQSAQIQLNPAHLGPLEVRIQIDSGQTSIVMNAAHPDTRHAMEADLPRLKEMLQQQGVQVGNCSVGAHAFSGSQERYTGNSQGSARGPSQSTASPAVAGTATAPMVTRTGKLQLVDIFA